MPEKPFSRDDLLAYLRDNHHAVVASINSEGGPSAALVGVAVSNDFELIFDTLSATRKHPNLMHDPRAALVYSGPGERTVQIDGRGRLLDPDVPADLALREVYLTTFPDGEARLKWEGLVHWIIKPVWARHVMYDQGEFITEFNWDEDGNPLP